MEGDRARSAVLGALARSPGLGVRDLVRETGHAHMTVRACLRSLKAKRRVKVAKDGARNRHFLAGQAVTNEIPQPIAEMAEFVKRHPGLREVDVIAAHSTIPRSTVQYRLRRVRELRLTLA